MKGISLSFVGVIFFVINFVITRPPYHRTYKPGELSVSLFLENEYTISPNYFLNVDHQNSNLEIRSSITKKIVWKNPPFGSFIGFENTTTDIKEFNGMFILNDGRIVSSCKNQQIDNIFKESNNSITINGSVSCEKRKFPKEKDEGIVEFSILIFDEITPKNENNSLLQMEFQFLSPTNSIHLSFGINACTGTRIHGMGVQNTYYDLKGHQVECIVSEHGVGRGKQPITGMVDFFHNRMGGNPTKSYSPVPFYITTCDIECSGIWTTTGYFLKDFYDVSIFDFTTWEFTDIWIYNTSPNTKKTIKMNIYSGDSVKSVVSQHVKNGLKEKNKLPILPDWYHSGVIIGLQGGTKRVKSILTNLLQENNNISISGIWLQDWSGQRDDTTENKQRIIWHWDLNQKHYPDWEDLVEFLHEKNIRLLSYINPFLIDPTSSSKKEYKYNYYKIMFENQCFIMNSTGSPYLFVNSFNAALLDLTNPKCVDLIKTMISRMLKLYHFDGYMLDFGEYTPIDNFEEETKIIIHDENMKDSIHNQYPELWQKINLEVVMSGVGGDSNEEEEKEKEITFFSRSGYSSSPIYSLSMWAGDQLTNWDKYDGIRSSMITLLTSGLSGFSNIHTDCGGYTSFQFDLGNVEVLEVSRSWNLLQRWMEFSAFTLVFRTHEGMDPKDNFQVYQTQESISLLCQLSIVFSCLFSYRKFIMEKNREDGVPIYKHLSLEYPNDSNTTKYWTEEYLFGDDFLIAPILDDQTKDKIIYLPGGKDQYWVDVWTNRVYNGDSIVTILNVVDGHPPVFFKEGSKFGNDFVQCIPRRKSECT